MGQQKAKVTAGKKKAKKLTPAQATAVKWIIGFAVVFAIIIALGLAVSNDWFDGFGPACTVGDVEISKEEYSFSFNSTYSSFVNYYSSYISALGLDTNKPLSEQKYDNDKTWQEYFDEQTYRSLADAVALSEEAKANGITLSQENQDTVDSYIANAKAVAKENKISMLAYTKSVYGRKLTENDIANSLSRILLAQQYTEVLRSSFEISDEEKAERYNNNKNDYDSVEYRVLTVSADIPKQDTMSDDEYALVTKDAMHKAKDEADALVASMKNEDGKVTEELFNQKALAYMQEKEADEDKRKNITADDTLANAKGIEMVDDEEGSNWLFDEARVAGDFTVIEGTEEYTIYFFKARISDDYKVVNIRHILVPFNSSNTAAQNTAEEDAAKAACDALKAEFISKGATEDIFDALAKEKGTDGTRDKGGLIEDVLKGTLEKAFDEWCFATERKPGDYEILKTSYGYHLAYFSGTGDTAWRIEADRDIRNERYEAKYAEIMENYAVKVNGEQVYIYKTEE